MQNNTLYCKKDFNIWKNHPWETTLFREGRKYKYNEEYNNDFFVYYDENNSSPSKRGHRFYTGELKIHKLDHIKDYFCNLQEYRKLKLQKLNQYNE